MTTVSCCVSCSRRSNSRMARLEPGSREATGSSARMIDACWTRTRAMATRCFWPPLSSPVFLSAESARPTSSRASRARSTSTRGKRSCSTCQNGTRQRLPLSTLARQVLSSTRQKSWKIIPTCCWTCRRFFPFRQSKRCPSTQTSPAVGRTMPLNSRRRVVLPAPLGPMTERNCPSGTERDTPSRMRCPF